MWGAVSDGSPIALEAEISWGKTPNFKGGTQVYGEIAPYLRRVGAKNGFSRISAENRQENRDKNVTNLRRMARRTR